jgi:hypothetical protein
MLQRHWARALADAGIDHARQHDLRHSFASWLVQAGRPLHEIAEVLGQTDVSVTRRYAHLANTHLDAVRDVLEATGTFRAIEGGAAADAATLPPFCHLIISRCSGSEPCRPRIHWVGDEGFEPPTPAV